MWTLPRSGAVSFIFGLEAKPFSRVMGEDVLIHTLRSACRAVDQRESLGNACVPATCARQLAAPATATQAVPPTTPVW